MKPNQLDAEQAIRTLISYAGDDPSREGLQETPSRVVSAFSEYFKGYLEDPKSILNTRFEDISGYNNVVILKDIPFYSHCEHHMAPIQGTIAIAYLPSNSVVGISKLVRVVNVFAKRLQIQEKMTAEIANCIQDNINLKAQGVAVYVKGLHHCMLGRGVTIQGSTLITSHFTGIYDKDQNERNHVQSLLMM